LINHSCCSAGFDLSLLRFHFKKTMLHNAYGSALILLNLLLAGGVLTAVASAPDSCKGEY
jgi:hypothetical protein